MIIKSSNDSLKILATYSPEQGIHVTASAVAEQLGDTFSTHIIERKDPRFVYAIARAVTADVPNKNHDLFPMDEIKRAYTSFIGRNMFLDHNTKSVRNAVGKIVAAELREDEEGQTYVACLFKIDRELHPDIARKIENGIIDSVSMGANVQEAECSQCHKRASREADFCEHLKNMHLYHDVYSINHGVEFTELSLVSVPADPTAKMHKVFNLHNGIEKVAIASETPNVEEAPKQTTSNPNVPLEQENVNVSNQVEPVTESEVAGTDVTVVKPEGTFFKIDCSSNESAELIFNIFYPYLNNEVEKLDISGRGVVIHLNESVKKPIDFINDACVMLGLNVQTGVIPERTAALYNGLFVSAMAKHTYEEKAELRNSIYDILESKYTVGSKEYKDAVLAFLLEYRAKGYRLDDLKKAIDTKKNKNENRDNEPADNTAAVANFIDTMYEVNGNKKPGTKPQEQTFDMNKLTEDEQNSIAFLLDAKENGLDITDEELETTIKIIPSDQLQSFLDKYKRVLPENAITKITEKLGTTQQQKKETKKEQKPKPEPKQVGTINNTPVNLIKQEGNEYTIEIESPGISAGYIIDVINKKLGDEATVKSAGDGKHYKITYSGDTLDLGDLTVSDEGTDVSTQQDPQVDKKTEESAGTGTEQQSVSGDKSTEETTVPEKQKRTDGVPQDPESLDEGEQPVVENQQGDTENKEQGMPATINEDQKQVEVEEEPTQAEKKQEWIDYVKSSYKLPEDPKEAYDFVDDLASALVRFTDANSSRTAADDILKDPDFFKSQAARSAFFKETDKIITADEETLKIDTKIPAYLRKKKQVKTQEEQTNIQTAINEADETGDTAPIEEAIESATTTEEKAEVLEETVKAVQDGNLQPEVGNEVFVKYFNPVYNSFEAQGNDAQADELKEKVESVAPEVADTVDGEQASGSTKQDETKTPGSDSSEGTQDQTKDSAQPGASTQQQQAKEEQQAEKTEEKVEEAEAVGEKLQDALRKIEGITVTFAGQELVAKSANISGLDFDTFLDEVAHPKQGSKDLNTYEINKKIEAKAQEQINKFRSAWGLLGGHTKYKENNHELIIVWNSTDGKYSYTLGAKRTDESTYVATCKITKAPNKGQLGAQGIQETGSTIVEALDSALRKAIQAATSTQAKQKTKQQNTQTQQNNTTTTTTNTTNNGNPQGGSTQTSGTPSAGSQSTNPNAGNPQKKDTFTPTSEMIPNIKVSSRNNYSELHVTEDVIFDMLTKVAESQTDLQTPTEIAVTEELKEGVIKENSMDKELKEAGCGTTPVAEETPTVLESTAAKDKEETPFAETEPKEEENTEEKGAEEGEGETVEIKKTDYTKAEKALNKVLKNELAEQAEGEEETEDVKSLKEAIGLLNMKEEKEEPKAETPAETPAVEETPAETTAEEENYNPFAGLKAQFVKKATIADSLWQVKTASNEDYLTFAVKAAFGNNIDNDTARSSYATSEEFGKAVVASLIDNKVETQTAAAAAVLGVVAHYTPSHAGVNAYKDNKPSSHSKASGEGDTETDKNLMAEKTASVTETITKQASEGEYCQKDTYLPGADNRPVKEGKDLEESAHPKAAEKVETTTDKHIIASYEEQLKKQAEEIQSLKLEATIKEKTAKVQEAVNMMVRAGLIKANEQVRVAGLKDGLSIEAANAKAMAASIDAQSKNLFGMNSSQLDSYISSLAALSPRTQVVTASTKTDALTVKASFAESEVDRLSKLLGWD